MHNKLDNFLLKITKQQLCVKYITRYKGYNLIFVRNFKAISLNLMFKLTPFLYIRTKYVHFLI